MGWLEGGWWWFFDLLVGWRVGGGCWFGGFFKQETNLSDFYWKSNTEDHKQAGRFLMDGGDNFSRQTLDGLKKRNYQ